MRQIRGYEKLVGTLGSFAFSEFRLLRSLHFLEATQAGHSTHRVELSIETELRVPNYRLKLLADGVVGLRLEGFGGGEVRVVGLDIVDISENQWENQAWELIDFENNSIEFRARSIEVVSIEALKSAV